ncbi:DNA-binding protein [Fredinandcohnia onubensis]|uniref:DNA-binding protein n=1 Tax=Fredinandcohnia onubensis TaxID=1571209 RepID=UPI000C0C0D84|nr:DNA-binding protein [Fredinandcohnia onubensis]
MGLLFLAIGIAVAGYFIGDGLKNFKNPEAKGVMEKLEEDDLYELIKEKDIAYHIGVSKEDAKQLIKEHPDIPHIVLNGTVYYPKSKLKQWLSNLGE